MSPLWLHQDSENILIGRTNNSLERFNKYLNQFFNVYSSGGKPKGAQFVEVIGCISLNYVDMIDSMGRPGGSLPQIHDPVTVNLIPADYTSFTI